MLPALVLVADIIGVLGGFLVSVYKLGFNSTGYINSTFQFLQAEDVTAGLVKAAVFGFIVALMGAYQGYNARAAPRASAPPPRRRWSPPRS